MASWYLEPPENNVTFNPKIFARSIDERGLSDAAADFREGMLGMIHLACYSDKRLVGEIDLGSLDLDVLKETFEELHSYESDEHGDDNTDLNNRGQTIVELNRRAGVTIHFDQFSAKVGPEEKQEVFLMKGLFLTSNTLTQQLQTLDNLITLKMLHQRGFEIPHDLAFEADCWGDTVLMLALGILFSCESVEREITRRSSNGTYEDRETVLLLEGYDDWVRLKSRYPEMAEAEEDMSSLDFSCDFMDRA